MMRWLGGRGPRRLIDRRAGRIRRRHIGKRLTLVREYGPTDAVVEGTLVAFWTIEADADGDTLAIRLADARIATERAQDGAVHAEHRYPTRTVHVHPSEWVTLQ